MPELAVTDRVDIERGRVEAGSPLLVGLEERWTALLLNSVSERARERAAEIVG